MGRWPGLLLGLCLCASPAAAGTLEGRLVTFTVMTWDDPGSPYLQARGQTVTVGQGVEFGLEPEGLTGGLDVVPVAVEIGPTRVEITYPEVSGQFYEATFNGYVLRFETECALFTGYRVDPAFSTIPMTEDDVFSEAGALFINLSAKHYGPDKRLAIDLDVAECPLS